MPSNRAAAFLFLPLLQAAAQEVYAPHVEEASEEARVAMESFEPMEGIEVQLFAAEPYLANPVCLYADHEGNFFVGETFRHYAGVTDIRDHMDWLDEDLASRTVADRLAMFQAHLGEDYDTFATEHERVRLIRDTDGDGVADFHSVFADGFSDHAAGIGAGLLSYEGDVYYTCIPDLWLLRDENGDGVAEHRRKLSTGYGVHVALLGHDLHGLRIGPDRRLYFSSGDRGFHVETENGVLAHPDSGAVLRCNLDGTGLEVVHSGLRNPQELAFDDHGNLFTGDNNSDGGDQARWVAIVEGGDSGWRYPYQWITAPMLRGPWNDEKLWYPPFPGQAAYIVPPIANLAHGPSGLTYYPGTGLPPEFAGHFFLCDFRGDASYSGIHTFRTHPKGASFELGEVQPFVWNTLVTDVDFGPDGGLYFTDWVHGWNKTGKGRLYRAVHPESYASALVAETRGLLAEGMAERELAELVGLLEHADRRVRQEAQFELVDRGAEGTQALVDVVRGFGSTLARIHAVWGLGIAGRSDARALTPLLELLADPEAEVRVQAVRVLGDERHAPSAAAIVELIGDDEPRVRAFAAIAAGRLRSPGAVAPLAELLRETGEEDRYLRHAAVMGLLGCASDEDLARLAADESPDVRLGALLVWRRRGDARLADFLGDTDRRVVVEAARAIGDVPVEAALPALASHELAPGSETALVRRVLNACFRLGQAERLVALALREDLEPDRRVEALEMLADWEEPTPRDRVLNAWRPLAPRDLAELEGVAAGLAAAGIATAPDPVLVAYARFVRASGAAELSGLLADWARALDRSPEVRAEAIATLVALDAPELREVVLVTIGDVDGGVRAAALEGLEHLSPEEALPFLPGILEKGEIAERRAAYRILGRSSTPEVVEILQAELIKLASDLIPAELALDLVAAAEAQEDYRVQVLLGRHQTPRQRDPELAPYLDALFGGDAGRGRDVYQKADLSCVRCHEAESDLVSVGPNLRDVPKRLSRLQMLESIVVPNRRTTPGYSATVFFLKGGGVESGRVLTEDAGIVTYLTSDGEVFELSVDDVDERRPDLSAMPEDLVQSLTREELRDLLAYLGTL